MENYLLERETYARHIGIPVDYLKEFVITERYCGSEEIHGFGLRIDSGRARQNNMFFDILKHKIAETSFRTSDRSIGIFQGSVAKRCRIYSAELKLEDGMIKLATPFRRKTYEFPFEELETLYQKYLFSDKNYINQGKIADDYWIDPLFYARHFNLPTKWLSWRIIFDKQRKTLLPVLIIKDTQKAISLYDGILIAVKPKETIRVKGNAPVRMLKENGEEGYVLLSMDCSNCLPGMETEIKLEIDEQRLEQVYHDRHYTPVMRPQLHFYE